MKTLGSLHVYIFFYDFWSAPYGFKIQCLPLWMLGSIATVSKWQCIKRYRTYEKDKEEMELKKTSMIISHICWYKKIQNLLQPCSWKGLKYLLFRRLIYFAIVNTIELRMVWFFFIIYKKCKGTSKLHILHPNSLWISQYNHFLSKKDQIWSHGH